VLPCYYDERAQEPRSNASASGEDSSLVSGLVESDGGTLIVGTTGALSMSTRPFRHAPSLMTTSAAKMSPADSCAWPQARSFEGVEISLDQPFDDDPPRADVAAYQALGTDGEAAGVQDGSFDLSLNDEILVGDQITLEAQRRAQGRALVCHRALRWDLDRRCPAVVA
jgi:hypothetical protein